MALYDNSERKHFILYKNYKSNTGYDNSLTNFSCVYAIKISVTH